jgi:hypothetical protein
MANKIENGALFVVREADELKFVASAVEGAARVAPVYLDGERLEGVYSEVKAGAIDSFVSDASISGERSEVAAGIEARNATLKKWSEAAKKASKAKKAGLSTVMLLSLAACGGGGGSAVQVKTDTISSTGDRVDISGANAGAVIQVADQTDGTNTYSNVTVNASGSGVLTIRFDDAEDTVVLSGDSVISGFSTIVVEKGTVDFTAVNLPASVNVLQVGSKAVVTYGQYFDLDSIELREGADATDRAIDLQVVVTSYSQAVAVHTDAENGDVGIIKANVDVEIVLKDGVGGELTIAQLVELQGLVSNEVESYSIKDAAQNIFVFENGVAIGFKEGVEAVLAAAEGLTVTDSKLSVSAELLKDLQDMGAAFTGQIFNLERSNAEVDEGGAVIFTLSTVNVAAGSTYSYQISGAGITSSDVVGGNLTGTFVIGADGKASLQVGLVADRLTEGQEALTLTVNGLSQTVVVNDTSVDAEKRFTTELDDLSGNAAFGNLFIGSVSANSLGTTFEPGDSVDGVGGENTLRLFMDPGTRADGVEVKNIQTLDLRLNAATNAENNAMSELVMTDWDDSLKTLNISSNKSNLIISEQQAIAGVSIVDGSSAQLSSSYSLGYAAGVLDGNEDELSLSVNNVNGTGGSDITIDKGMEKVVLAVADRKGGQYASNINLAASGVNNVQLTGGHAQQAFTLNAALLASGAALNSTAFAGDLNLTSGTIFTAVLGAGNDVVNLTGQAAKDGSSYDLGEGDNSFTFAGTLGGSVSAGSGDDTVSVNATGEGSRIALGAGQNTTTIAGVHAGNLTGGSDGNTVTAASTAAGSSISLGDGANSVNISGAHAGGLVTGSGVDTVSVGSTLAGSLVNLGDGDNIFTVTGTHAGSLLISTEN